MSVSDGDLAAQRQFLDKEIRVVSVSDLPRAKKILDSLVADRKKIASQISSSSAAGSTALHAAVRDARACVDEVSSVGTSRREVGSKVETCLSSSSALRSKLSPLLDGVQPLETCKHYLQWVQMLSAISNAIASYHGAGNTVAAVDAFHDLLLLEKSAVSVMPSGSNLHRCLLQHLSHWRQTLESVLTKEFDESLTELNWPFISGKVALASIPVELLASFRQQISLLLKLKPYSSGDDGVSVDEIPYPLELMIRPLRKRFRYHFHGKRQTNDVKKPEWYLTQIRSWITGHSGFLARTVQPILSECCERKVPVERLFVQAMVSLVIGKLRKDTVQLRAEPAVLSHTIDEVLSFSTDLSSLTATTAAERQSLLSMLEEESLLAPWLSVEEMLMLQHMDTSLGSPTAWQSRYLEVEDVDDTRAPECVELVMTYTRAVTDRYKDLPSLQPRLLFCRLQLQAIDRFTSHITRLMERELSDCTGMMFAALLCAVQYMLDILADWAEQPFFLSLEERLRDEEEERLQSSEPSLPVTKFLTSKLSSLSMSLSSEENRSLFAPSLAQLNSIKQQMLESVVNAILADFRLASKALVQQKWVSFPSPHEVVVPEVSDAACDLLVSLRHHLHLAEKRLPSKLFTPVWINLATQLDSFVFEKVILQISVNAGGAAQLKFDLMRNLVALFSTCTGRPERYFPLVREACSLLTLLPGSAVLLREELQAAAKENASMAELDGSATKAAEVALVGMDVKNIPLHQAGGVLNRRIDWPQA